MIVEVAILNVIEDQTDHFERDFATASQFISAMKGYLGHTLRRCLEQRNKYLLLVNWESVEDHEPGFRQSKEYLEWKKLLHHYYQPFPTVEHYELVMEDRLT